MHIAFLTPEYPHSRISRSGGLGTSIKNLAVSLAEVETQVTIFVYGQKEDMEFKEDGITFFVIRQRKYKMFTWYYYRKFLQKLINRKICEGKIDLVEAPDWTGITAFMNFRCPLIIRMNGTDAYFCHLERRRQKWKNRFFEKKALHYADALVSVSAFTAKKTLEIFQLKKPVIVIPNSVDTSQFLPSPTPVVPNRLLYFGTVIRKKGVIELAEIFNLIVKKNPKTELFLIGKDVIDIFRNTSTKELFNKQLSSEALLQVRFLEEVNYSEVKKHLAEATVVILPSFAEALPMTWLEAMAMEKALVTSNIGWAKEVMLDGITGYTENPKNHKAFAAKVLQLVHDKEAALKMGKAARLRVVQNFSTEVVTEKNLEFYRKLIPLKKR